MGKTVPEDRPGDEPPVSDEEWAEFLRRAGEGGRDAPVEPSARARMVAGRLRAEESAAGRASRWSERPRKRRRLGPVLAGVSVLALAVVAVRPEAVVDLLPGAAGGSGPDTAPLAAETARPTEAPSEELFPDMPTVKEPFRGSPAVAWADGAAGIQVPPAEAVGGMSEDQVAHALRSTKELLVASNLDPATLRGGHPGKALRLLDPLQKDGHGLLVKGLREPREDQDPLWLFSRFDPAEVRVVGEVVKARGRMTFGKGDRDGSVEVKADYTFVYPLIKAKPGAEEVTRTIVRREVTVTLHDPARTVTTPGRLVVVAWNTNTGNSDCARDGDGFLHPQFQEDMTGLTPGPSGPAVDPYDRSKDLGALPQECGTVTRT
ncbi:hypothetical protein QRN89_20675 [Streptomyces chengbuensis]|uniref:hypothetical protein n=1 Tax=Streptomyces TaxID=1883 RepID=UPI0025B5986D|nr:hypothetical protein [Streptomyces sp. HUAS CB01]WJY51995.1 hypothetical protein QRN89_20675 [Streptomyces sp. HUAS CB01]